MRAALCGGIGIFALAGVAAATTTINHQFTPATINPGDVSAYRISVANSSTVQLFSAAVTVNLPPQITIVNPPAIQNTCGFTVDAAAPGTSTVALSAGTIPAGTGSVDGTCFFQLNVTSTVPGNWVSTIPVGGFTATENGVPVSNGTAASATLSVNTLSNPTGSKTFAPSPGIAGDPITLTITLTNPNAGVTVPLTTFTDTLPAGMLVANPPTASTSCSGTGSANGVLTATAGSNTVTLTGGTMGQGGTCTISAKVTVASIAGASQAFSNAVLVGAIGNTRGLTSPAFNRNETVNTPIGVTKTFGTPAIRAGQPSLMTLTIGNASTANPLSITTFTDNLAGPPATTLIILNTASSPVPAPANPAVTCTGAGAVNGTLSAPPDVPNQPITLTGATAGPGGSCTITAYLTSLIDGPHVNSVAANAVGNPNNFASPAASATLTANAQLSVAKTVSVANVAPGQWTRFDVTISNFSAGAVSGVVFTDVLPKTGTDQMTLFPPLHSESAGCSGGTFFGTDGSGNSTTVPPVAGDAGLLWSGGTIVGGVGANPGLCTISIFAQLPATAPVGTVFTNSIPINAISAIDGLGNTIHNTNATSVNVTTIASANVTKSFNLASIAQGATSTLTITIFNRTVSGLTGVNLTDNFPAGSLGGQMTLASNPAPTNACGGSLQAFPNDTKVVLTSGTVAARPPGSQDSNCAITVKVTAPLVGTYPNTIPIANFSNAQGALPSAPANATLTVTTGLTGSKTFTPTSVASGGTSRVRITINNTSSGGLTNVSIDDNTFGAGLTVANPSNPATSCAGSPSLVVNPGATRAQLLGATLAAAGSCDFSFDVVTAGGGPWTNSVPAGKVTSAQGVTNTAAISGTLNASAAQININKSFNPVLVSGGVPSILQIDVTNASAIVINGVRFTDTFPPGIEVYSVPAASTDCAGGTVTAIPGDGKVSLSGATLNASQTCHVFVTTTSTRFLNLTNTIPANAVVSNQGYTNPTGTSATLSTLQGLGVLKGFSPAYVVPNQVSTLKMRLISTLDPNAPTPLTLTGVTYTDTLPAGVFISATPNATTTCVGTGPGGLAVVSTSNGASGVVTVSQATIPPATNCAIAVDVVASALGAYNNTIPANSVTSDQGIPNANAASATLFVVSQPTVSKAFANPTRNPGQTTTLTVTINNGSAVPLTGVSLTDTLPAGVAVASVPAAATTCAGGSAAASAGGGTLSVSGATVPAGGSCNVSATVVGNTPGVYINNINPGSIVSNEGLTNSGSAQATLTVNSQPTVAKAFNPVSIAAGGTSTLTLSLGNPNTTNITLSAAFVDALPGNVAVAAVPNVVKTCTGAVTAAAGATTITYANGSTIPTAGGGCTISVDVTSSTPGTYTNTIAAGQLSTSAGVNQQPAVANLAVGPGALVPPTMSKSFSPGTILTGGISTLTINLGNPNTGALTVQAPGFTDTLPGNVVLAASPNVRGSCNTPDVTAAGGGGTITFAANASIPAGGCTILVDVTSAVAGSYTNTIPTTALVTDGGSPSLPATAGLVVQALVPPTVTKFFSPSTINPGATSTLTISLGNSNAGDATLTSPFTDNLPANVLVASVPNAGTTCTGGTASTGAASVTLSGGVVQHGGCVVTVDVTSNVPGGPYTNTIVAGALQTSVGSNGGTTTANLLVNPFQPPSVAKSFTPTVIGAGGISKLAIALSNGNASDATLNADFVDTLPGPGLAIANPPNLTLSANCTAGKVVAAAGGTTVTYQSGGVLKGNGGCTIQVDVTSGTVRVYTNTIAVGAVQTTVGNNVVSASANLQVLALPTVGKAFSPISIPLGSSSTLTLTLGNTNASALTVNADFVDTLPANLVLGTPATVGGTCAAANVVAAAGGPSVTYKSGATIPAGGCTITVPVTSGLGGTYVNTILAGALSTTIGGNPAGASATLDILEADLSVTKTDGVATVVPGTATTYTIVVSNAGPSPVANAPVSDPLPAGIGSMTWTCAASAGSSCGAASGSGSIASTVSLLPGGSATYVVLANVLPAALGTVANTATVAAPAGVPDPNPANNSATDTDNLTPQADLQVVKAGPAAVVPGQNISYTITATNAGPSTATTVSLTDLLAPGTTFVSLATPGGWACLTPPVGGTGSVSCSTASFAPPSPASFTLVVNLASSVSAGTSVSNTATITSATPDPNPGDNASTTTGTAAPSADLAIVKTGPATAVPGGPNLVFTTVVTNNGPSDAQGVSVADPTPANLVFVSNAGDCTSAFPCVLGALPAGATRNITTTFQIPSAYPAGTPIDNTATVSSTTPDPVPGNNASTATVLVPTGVADVAVAKTVDNPAPTVGSNVTFTVTASDLGPSDATGVEVTDVLPSGLTFVSAAPSQGSFAPATGVWTVGGIAAGSSQTILITATVTQPGVIVNTATKTAGNETDPDSSNNSGSAVVSGPPAVADIQVQKTVDVPAPAVGANVTFTITVHNAGPSPATNVQVTDLLPAGLTFVSALPSVGSYDSVTGIWSIGAMANGSTVTLGITANVPGAGTFVNTAQKTGETELDPNTGNDQASAVVVAGGGGGALADLSIQKTDSPDPVFAGQTLTYTLLVTNHGPDGATAVTVTDPLPAAATLASASASQGGCGGTTTVVCTLGGLAAGNSATVSLVVTVSAAGAPAIVNTATVAATETDPNPTDNTATATTGVTPVADVAVSKTVSNPAPLVSQTFTFTVTVSNNGPSTATGVAVTDVLPANLTFVGAAPTLGAYAPGTGIWTVGTLANGQIETLVITVLAAAPGAFTNTAVKTGEVELDPNPANDSASVGGGVAVVADLTIVKTHAPATFLRGASGTFTLTVSNVGTGPTTSPVTVTDGLPAGLTATAASGTGWGCVVGAAVVCARSDVLAAGASWPPISVTASVAQSAAANVSNTATVSGGGDIDPANDSSTDVVPVGSQADLALVKTGPANAIPGTNIVYTLVVTNNGPSDALGVVVSDPTPPNLTFVSNGGACATAFPCSLGTIASGGSATITATFAIPAGYTTPSPIVNSASVTGATPDPTPANNASSASTAVSADLEAVKTSSTPTILLGIPFSYQIVVTNHGPSDATGVTLTDPLPAQVTFQSATATQGACSGTTTVTCALGTLANGASATVVITVVPPTTAAPGPVANTAMVAANESDPDPTNNSSTATAVLGSPAIPTLSQWALAGLALALAAAGVWASRRP